MKKRELAQYIKAKEEALFLFRREICGSMQDAVVVALCKQFGKASAEHKQMLLIDTHATIIVKKEAEQLNRTGFAFRAYRIDGTPYYISEESLTDMKATLKGLYPQAEIEVRA